jgi:hypothetical protein
MRSLIEAPRHHESTTRRAAVVKGCFLLSSAHWMFPVIASVSFDPPATEVQVEVRMHASRARRRARSSLG